MNTSNDMLKRYLLDDATEEEMVAIEERFVTDDAAYAEMLAVEDELFYEYNENELDAAERNTFERKFLATREGRDRLAFAGVFLETTGEMAHTPATEEKKSMLAAIAAFFNFGSALQFGMAAAALLLAFGIVGLLVQNQRIRSDLAAAEQQNEAVRRENEARLAENQKQREQIENDLAAERDKAAANDERIKELETEKKKLEAEAAERRRRIDETPNIAPPGGRSTIATAILSPGLFTRSDGQPMNRIKLAPSASALRLALRLKNVNVADYASYTVNVTDVDSGDTIFTRPGLRPSGGGAVKNLGINLQARQMARGDYAINLIGITKTGQSEEITTYYFSVDK